VSRFSSFVFSVRKTTPQYMRSAYGDVPTELLEVLGFSKVFEGSLPSYIG